MSHYECRKLFEAGKSLLEGSRLVRYSNGIFLSNDDEEGLETYWKENFAPGFGRYMAWVWFSIGAEKLVKAALVCNGLLEAKKQNDSYPVYRHDTDKENWVDEVLSTRRNAGGGYGNLGDIWKFKLRDLSEKRHHTEAEFKEMKAAYKYLTQAIRNRDAHAYVANQRRRDFLAFEPVFLPAFNNLVGTMKDKEHFDATGL